MGLVYYESPIGYVEIHATDDCVTKIRIQDHITEPENNPHLQILIDAKLQIKEYFQGTRKNFDFKYENKGTPFRQAVWRELEKVVYGTTATYKSIGLAMGNPKAVRAIGGANHHNNIWLVVPCHRIIGSNGKLVGYGGGLWRKEWLLAHEKQMCHYAQQSGIEHEAYTCLMPE